MIESSKFNFPENSITKYEFYHGKEVIGFFLHEDKNGFDITCRVPSNNMCLTNPPQMAPDSVWKEIYRIADGKLELEKRISGKHTPGHYVEENISFENE